MLSFFIGNSSIELPPDFSLTMNLKSPVFGDIGSYSYPFKVPNSPRNAIAIGFRHRIPVTANPYQTLQGHFSWKNSILFPGTVKLRIFNDSVLEGSILEGSGDFNFQVKNNNLNQYDFGNQAFASESEALAWINNCRSYAYPNRVCAFPQVYNESYFEEMPAEVSLLHYNFYWIPDDQIHALSINGKRTPIVPFLFLRYVLDTLISKMKYCLDDRFFKKYSAFSQLVLYNSVSINNEGGVFPYDLSHIYYNYHLPKLKVSDFIAGLETFFNVRFFYNNTTKTVSIISVDDIVNTPDYIEFSRNIISISTELQNEINGYSLKMSLDGDDGAFETQSNAEEELLKNLAGSVNSFSDLPAWPLSPDLEIRYVIDSQKYYQLRNRVWLPLSSSLSLKTQYLYKDSGESIETKFSTLVMGDNTNTIFCTCKNQQSNFSQITPRLFYSKYANYGDHLIVQGYNYDPFAGSLLYDGQTGLFERQWKNYLDFRMTSKLVRITKLMTFAELKDFDFSRKYMIFGIKYLVASIQVTIKRDRIMPAVLECYPVS